MKKKAMYFLLFILMISFYLLCETEGWLVRELPDTKEKIARSPNFDHATHRAKNVETTTELFSIEKGDKEKRSTARIMYELFLNPDKPKSVPVVSGSLKQRSTSLLGEVKAAPDTDFVLWYGHSSYLLHLGGKNILIDPLLDNEAASPVPFINTPFKGTGVFSLDDIPQTIDVLLITHDHYDHLGKKTLKKIAKNKTVHCVITPLGVGKYLKHYGFSQDIIHQTDWGDSTKIDDIFSVDTHTARHFSGRGMFNKNKSLWASYVLHYGDKKIFIGGDSGYGKHFQQIGEQYGKMDWAFLENGQYDAGWREIHAFPEQTFQEALDLKATVLFPVHNSKYKISYHAWDTPMKDLWAIHQKNPQAVRLVTPKIGEIVPFEGEYISKQWWENVQ
ncbi:MAG: MBL fold metallo-hydrolase [Neisseriaceae bacterium]|nr:MBL fold metallo-hydrolase [Neisseriaceae bacterium]